MLSGCRGYVKIVSEGPRENVNAFRDFPIVPVESKGRVGALKRPRVLSSQLPEGYVGAGPREEPTYDQGQYVRSTSTHIAPLVE